MRESYKYRKSSFTNKDKREGASLHKVNTWLAHSSIFFRRHLPPPHKFNIHLCVSGGGGTECHSLHVARGELVLLFSVRMFSILSTSLDGAMREGIPENTLLELITENACNTLCLLLQIPNATV